MKKYINRNYFLASLFVKQLETLAIKNVCISPGSRNTPLTLAFAANKKFKKYIHVDERSSGFFALGLAKKNNKPVVLVTTSGTAVAELYPAIIEAYLQRIPLLVCTADRPEYLRNTGANQTINQENIFKNHIRKFLDVGLPNLDKKKLSSFTKSVTEIISIANEKDKGPVHINFPFEKPLEPNSFTDDISFRLSNFIIDKKVIKNESAKKYEKVINEIKQFKKIIIFIGWDNYDQTFYKTLTRFSQKGNVPIFVDGTTDFRYIKTKTQNVIVNHTAFLKSEAVLKKVEPEIIIQFGNAPTSQTMLRFFERTNAKLLLINEFGNKKNASAQPCEIIKANPSNFLSKLNENAKYISTDFEWAENIYNYNKVSEELKSKLIKKAGFGYEPRVVTELLNIIPENSNLFISNSMPVRDFDFFASGEFKNLNIYTNRGASGIDGIISTASGIAVQRNQKTFLVIGDLAFYHNISALATLSELKIPLIIILVNNNGGGIFNMLPIASMEKNSFEKYFITSQNLNFKAIVKSFGGNYYLSKSWKEFKYNMQKAINRKTYSVIEIKTDSKKSLLLRKKYWSLVKNKIK